MSMSPALSVLCLTFSVLQILFGHSVFNEGVIRVEQMVHSAVYETEMFTLVDCVGNENVTSSTMSIEFASTGT